MPTTDVSDPPVPVTQDLPSQPKQLWLSNFAAGFRSLRIRNYRLYSISQLISLTGTWMQTTAQAWLVLKLTHSPFQVGLVVTLQFLPVTILALFGGVLADRLPKRETIIGTQSLALIQAAIFGLLVLIGVIQLWEIYVLAVFQGVITAIDNPVRQSFVVEMVGREDLPNAVSLNSMIFNGARIIGPSLAGVVIQIIGIAPALLLNALSFVPVIVALLMMDPAALFAPPPAQQGSVLQKLKEGLDYSLHTPSILLILIVIAALGTFGYNFSVVLPLLADNVLKTDAFGFGLLSSCLGIGSLIAAFQSAYVRNVTVRRLLIGSGAFSLFFAGIALSTSFALTAIFLIALGFSGIVFSTSSNTLLQLRSPDALRGRIISLNVLLFIGSTPVGGFLVGTMSEYLGVPAALLTCAILCGLGVIIAWWYQRRVPDAPDMPEKIKNSQAA